MIRGIRNRMRSLSGCDRLLLALTGIWTIVGIPGNYSLLHGFVYGGPLLWSLVGGTLWASIAVVIAYSVIRRQRRLRDYGFSFGSGGLASLAILAAIHIYLVLSGKIVLSAIDSTLPALGAFMEEIAFRVIAIDKLILLMDGIRDKVFWAILASSALWSIPHVVSKSPAGLLGIFMSALILGYVYYKGSPQEFVELPDSRISEGLGISG